MMSRAITVEKQGEKDALGASLLRNGHSFSTVVMPCNTACDKSARLIYLNCKLPCAETVAEDITITHSSGM